eukprot:TRINITY_DN9496_c0_g1_i2.p2 TRINITY_DN9496_c0_g1~~TRINITY_DN9496_c0_g1_i2.p2  ORF type:complete len:109 (+),score=17.45 TRINITY_DN9496_c0_g1_i2:901-1227(+)
MSGNRGGNRSGGKNKGKKGGSSQRGSGDKSAPESPVSPSSPASPTSGQTFDYVEAQAWMSSLWESWSEQKNLTTFSCSGGSKREAPAAQVMQSLQEIGTKASQTQGAS